ncbi:MAG: EAL domain-containing protein [Eubacteriales bacterium]|nr:EAL domain-containing protein [Eubacteriales bacterium]
MLINSKEQIQMLCVAAEQFERCTEDFLFVCDLQTNQYWFYGNYAKDYALNDGAGHLVTPEAFLAVVHPDDREMLRKEIADITAGVKDTHRMNYRWVKRNGDVVWVNCQGNALCDENGAPRAFVGRASDKSLIHLYDPMTGLWNKTKLLDDLEHNTWPGAKCLMMIDIANMAAVNMVHGREYGDEIVKTVARKLERIPEVLAAYRADTQNFIAIVKSTEDCTEHRCLDMCAAKKVFDDLAKSTAEQCTLTASAVPASKKLYIDASQMLDTAYLMLQSQKRTQKGCLKTYHEEDIERQKRTYILIKEMEASIQNQFTGFYLEYQPQIQAGTYQLYGTEALLRYHSPSFGDISPVEFVPLLEQTHMISAVGLWVMDQGIRQYKRWSRMMPEIHMSVNVSPVQFEDSALGEKVTQLFRTHGVSGSNFTIEITESAHLLDSPRYREILHKLQCQGIQISIDDYGTGYSNVSYLKVLPVSEIKIDRIFVSNIKKGSYNYNLIRIILDFARMNGIRVCCEGVESVDELGILESIKADIFQGYLFHKPCLPDVIEETFLNSGATVFAQYQQSIRQIAQEVNELGALDFDTKDILRENDVGLWMFQVEDDNRRWKMYLNDGRRGVLGMDEKLSPDECYQYWLGRIHADDVAAVQAALGRAAKTATHQYVAYR